MGTGPFAVPMLRGLLASRHAVLAVVTRPAHAPAGRRPPPNPMRDAALAAGLPILDPERVNDPDAVAAVAALAPDLLVVCDDLSLPLGKLRIRRGGSDGGQKGLRDIAAQLGSQDFARLRIGIGERGPIDAADFVLSRFRPPERPIIDDGLILATQAVAVWVIQGVDVAMNRFNGPNGTGA